MKILRQLRKVRIKSRLLQSADEMAVLDPKNLIQLDSEDIDELKDKSGWPELEMHQNQPED